MTWRPILISPLSLPSLPVYEFDKQRAKCKSCLHMGSRRTIPGQRKPPIDTMLCLTTTQSLACSSMRFDGECGPGAKLFQPRRELLRKD